MPRILSISIALLTMATAPGGPLRADPIDDAVAAQMARRHIPGVSIAIIQGGEVIRAKGYGAADLSSGAPVTPETLFQAGSVSKPVTAMGALALVDAGRLSLDADINTELRSWHVPENGFTGGSKVTLRRLLSHSAGTTVHGFPGYATGAPVPTLVQVLDGKAPANTPAIRVDVVPGSQWRYSGGGYVIVQQAVIDVTGEPFPAYMRAHVLKPLGMAASTFEQPLPADRMPSAATGYYPRAKPVPGRWHVYPEMAPAGLWTTPSDLARFAIAVQQSLVGRAAPVITQATAREMLTPQKGDFGLGLALSGKGATRRFGHNGRDEGFDTFLTAYCESGQGAVVMTNANDDSSAVPRMVEAIADAYRWPDYPHRKAPQPIEDREPGVTAQVRQIFEQAQTGAFDRKLYTEELANLIAPQLAPGGAARTELASYGALKSVALVGRNNEAGLRSYHYIFKYEHEAVLVHCSYDGSGRIAGLFFEPE